VWVVVGQLIPRRTTGGYENEEDGMSVNNDLMCIQTPHDNQLVHGLITGIDTFIDTLPTRIPDRIPTLT
jgi:hypothetical protein